MVEIVGESRTGMLLLLPLLSRRRRSRSFSEGVGELRCDAKSSFLRSASRRLRILWITTILACRVGVSVHFSIVSLSSSSRAFEESCSSLEVVCSSNASNMMMEVS